MHSHDYTMAPGGDLPDRLIEDGRGGPPSGADAWGADVHRIDDLTFDPRSHSHAGYRTSDRNPHAEPEFPRLFYRSYEPEMPPPAGYERLTPPPPVLAPGPELEPIRYQDGPMTQALFDWNMLHLPDAPMTPGEGWIGSFGDVIPARLAEIMIESSCLHSPPPDEPW